MALIRRAGGRASRKDRRDTGHLHPAELQQHDTSVGVFLKVVVETQDKVTWSVWRVVNGANWTVK